MKRNVIVASELCNSKDGRERDGINSSISHIFQRSLWTEHMQPVRKYGYNIRFLPNNNILTTNILSTQIPRFPIIRSTIYRILFASREAQIRLITLSLYCHNEWSILRFVFCWLFMGRFKCLREFCRVQGSVQVSQRQQDTQISQSDYKARKDLLNSDWSDHNQSDFEIGFLS